MEGEIGKSVGRLTSDLVRIPSVSNTGAVRDAADFIEGWLKGNGISAKTMEYEKGSPIVIAEVGRGSKTIMLNGHMDVVPPGDSKAWKAGPFSGKMSGGTVYGRGSADMKSGLAVYMRLVAELADSTDFRIMFAAVPDEEVGGRNGSRILAEKHRPDLVLIGESGTGGRMIGLGEKGLLEVTLTSKGKVAHASMPSKGDNAIMKTLRDLERLSAISERRVKAPKDAVEMLETGARRFGRDVKGITFNAGTISGGVAANVVADRCSALVDMRLPPGISSAEALKLVKSMVKESDVGIFGRSEPNYTSPNVPSVASFIRAVRRTIPRAETYLKSGATDGRFFRGKGIPTVALGPGSNRIMHSYNEYVTFGEIEATYRAYLDFLSQDTLSEIL